MPDHNGATLKPGDAVLWGHGPDYRAPATVLRVLGPNRYLIQFEPHDPTADSSGCARVLRGVTSRGNRPRNRRPRNAGSFAIKIRRNRSR